MDRATRRAGAALLLVGALLLPLTSPAQTADDAATCGLGRPVGPDDPWLDHAVVPLPLPAAFAGRDGDAYTDGDPVYLDVAGTGDVAVGDVRLAPGAEPYAPGSRVGPGDVDIGRPLRALDAATVAFLDEDLDGTWQHGEPILLDTQGDGRLAGGDVYLHPPDRAGTTHREDPRQPSPAANLTAMPGGFAVLELTDPRDGTVQRFAVWDADADGRIGPTDLCFQALPPRPTEPSPTPTPEPTRSPDEPTPSPTPTRSPDTTESPTMRPLTRQQPGGFEASQDRFDGRYVTLRLDTPEGLVLTPRVDGALFFDRLRLPCPCNSSLLVDAHGRPTGLALQGTGAHITLWDQPNGLVRFSSDGAAAVTFHLGAGTHAEPGPDGSLRLTQAGHVAWLTAHASVADTPAHLTTSTDADGDRTIEASGLGLFFLPDPPSAEPLFRRHHDPLAQAILERRLAAQVQVLSTPEGNEAQLLAYDRLNDLTVTQPGPLTYEIRIDADLPDGRAFVFQFPRAALPADEVGLRYLRTPVGGATGEVPLLPAATLEQVLQVRPGDPALAWIDATDDGFVVAVSVPRFSIQLFQVLGVPPEAAPIFAYGVVLVLLFVGLVGIGALVGRRGRPMWRPPRTRLLAGPGEPSV